VKERLVDRRVRTLTHTVSDRLQGLDRTGQLGGDLPGHPSRPLADRRPCCPEGRSGEHGLPLDGRLLAGTGPRSRDPPRDGGGHLVHLRAGAKARRVHGRAVVALPVGTNEDGRLAGCRRWTRWRWRSRRCLSWALEVPTHVLDRRADLLFKPLLLVQERQLHL